MADLYELADHIKKARRENPSPVFAPDRRGTTLRPGDTVLCPDGVQRRVLALWIDSADGTNVSLLTPNVEGPARRAKSQSLLLVEAA